MAGKQRFQWKVLLQHHYKLQTSGIRTRPKLGDLTLHCSLVAHGQYLSLWRQSITVLMACGSSIN